MITITAQLQLNADNKYGSLTVRLSSRGRTERKLLLPPRRDGQTLTHKFGKKVISPLRILLKNTTHPPSYNVARRGAPTPTTNPSIKYTSHEFAKICLAFNSKISQA